MIRRLVPWIAVLVAAVLLLLSLRARLDQVHIVLMLLLVVLGGSASGGRLVGLTVAGLSFLAFNWFFLPPYNTLAIADPLDWMVLIVYLVVALVATQLLHRAQEQTRLARERAVEIDQMAVREESLKASDRLKSAFLAAVSHDLRTPLTSIKALAQDLRTHGDERAAIIEEEADRLNRQVADLLDLSQIASGGPAMRSELTPVDELIVGLLQRTEGAIAPKRIEVRFAADDPLLVGRFDLTHALRALGNLVDNAASHDRSAAPIEITVERRGTHVAIDVFDRGPGVPPDERLRVFEAFERGSIARARHGAGLGLSIARGLAQVQGGDVSYADRPGGGSIFTLLLPSAELNEAL